MLRKVATKIFANTLPLGFIEEVISSRNLIKLLNNFTINKIFDVGANKGHYAELLLNNGYQGKIVSFEPLTEAYNSLLLKKNNVEQWKIAERCALGDQDKEIRINISKNLYSSSILPMLSTHSDYAPKSQYIDTENVQMFKLDTIGPKYIEKDDILFLKLDVQGYEKFVLQGAEKILNRFEGIQLECSLLSLYEGEMLFLESMRTIEGKGFTLCDIIPGFRAKSSGRLLQVDCVYFKMIE